MSHLAGGPDEIYEEALRLWVEGRLVELERQRSEKSVLLVYLPHHVFDELVEEAQRQGKGPGTLAGELIEVAVMRSPLEVAVLEALSGGQEEDPVELIPRLAEELEVKEDQVRAAIWRLLDRGEVELTATWKLRRSARVS